MSVLEQRLRQVLPGLVTALVLVGVWQGLVRGLDVQAFILPAPSDIAAALADGLGAILPAAAVTVRSVLLGLVVDLYGKTRSDPVIVRINAQPEKGLLGQLLCGLAGGGGVTDLAGLQSLLSSLGVNVSTTQLQTLLTQLGIGNLSGGLTQLDLNRILRALGLGQTLPTG